MTKQVVIAAIQIDLPELVAPAISKCGMVVKSETRGCPDTSLPKGIASGEFTRVKFSDSKIGRSLTMVCTAFGISMPT